MSEDKTNYCPPLAVHARPFAHASACPPTREERIAHLGRLALAWALAAEAFESEYTIDQHRRRELMKAMDAAEERLRVACLAALGSDPGIGEAGGQV